MSNWHVGDRAYLVPTLPTAPRPAYQQPQCVITALTGNRAEIELPDGHRLWTSRRNLSVRPLEPPRPTTPPARTPKLALANGEQETTLW